jgi:hypothetical protein
LFLALYLWHYFGADFFINRMLVATIVNTALYLWHSFWHSLVQPSSIAAATSPPMHFQTPSAMVDGHTAKGFTTCKTCHVDQDEHRLGKVECLSWGSRKELTQVIETIKAIQSTMVQRAQTASGCPQLAIYQHENTVGYHHAECPYCPINQVSLRSMKRVFAKMHEACTTANGGPLTPERLRDLNNYYLRLHMDVQDLVGSLPCPIRHHVAVRPLDELVNKLEEVLRVATSRRGA